MSEQVGLGQVGLTMLRHWLLVTLGVVIGAAGAFAITLLVPKTYTATSVQLVKGVPGTGVAANYEAAQYAVNRAKSYPAFIGSLQVLEGVRDDVGDSETVDQLRLELTATNPTDTPLIRITATGGTAADAQAKANSAARHLSRFITQIEMVSGRSPVLVETAVQAGLPQDPSSPQTKLFLAVGAALGLSITIAIALIRDYMPLARSRSPRRRRAVDQDEPSLSPTRGAAPPGAHDGDHRPRPAADEVVVGPAREVTSTKPDEVIDVATEPSTGETTQAGVAEQEELDETLEPWRWLEDDMVEEQSTRSSQHGDHATGPSTDPAEGDEADDASPTSRRSTSTSSRRG